MHASRRRLLLSTLGGASALTFAGWPSLALAKDEIVVGHLQDLSGPLQVFGVPKSRVLQFAVDETNAAGGLLGRQVRLVTYDTQSNNQLYAQFAQTVALRDKAAVCFGAVTSAAREVARPVLGRSRTPYFYNMTYEGGVCDRNTFVTGITPSQQLAIMIPELVRRFGKKIYVLAADYNFGQLSTQWIRKMAAEAGAQVVGAELFPLDVSSFAPTISKIQAAAPDFIVNSFVGPAHAAFYGQWAASGMKDRIPVASQTFGDAADHLLMPKEVSEGILICTNYFQELDAGTNHAFVRRFQEKMGTKDYITVLAMNDYVGWQLWSAAVEKAGSIDREKVLDALESGLTVDVPHGQITMEGTTHHCTMDMYLTEVRDGGYRVLQKTAAVPSIDMAGQCDLLARPATNQQFVPKI